MSLWVVPTGATEPVQYRQSPFPQTFARSWTIDFSRDGSELAVLMEREGASGFTTELWIVPFPSGSPRRVSEALPSCQMPVRRASVGCPITGISSWMLQCSAIRE